MASFGYLTRSRSLLFVALLGSLAVAPAVRAETSAPTVAEKAKAKRSLERGQKLYKAGKLEEAQAAFRESHDAVPDPKALLMIARCQRDNGELLKAHDTYKAAQEEADAAAARGEARRATTDEIRKDQRELDGILGWVTIELSHAPSGTHVTIDGRDVTGELGGPIRVAPGPVVVVGTTSSGVEKSQKLSIRAGQTANVELSFTWSGRSDEALANAPDEGGEQPSQPEPEPTHKRSKGGKSNAPIWVAGGATVAGAAVFGIFGVLANGKFKELKDGCVDKHCPDYLENNKDEGQMFQTVANVGLVVGVVGLGTAITLFALGGPSDAAPYEQSSLPKLKVGLGSVELSGSFQ